MTDHIDRSILRLLQKDAKMTTKELASQLSLTATPVFERVKRLEKDGYIKGYRAVLDRHKLNLPLVVFCNVELEKHREEFLARFEQDVQSLPEVVECYHIAGHYDYLLKVVVKDMEVYQHFVTRKLAALENIGKVQSSFVMTEVKDSGLLPVAT
ncbi:MAG: Lrp/AsnC family transcriptional regulator [Bacteroidia bacterium]